MLIFDPETSARSLRDSLSFLKRNADVPMNFCRTEIYVGTPLMHKLEREKRLFGDVFGWDYAISDPAAERAFRVFARAFLDRNFRCDGLMNSTLSLGYYLHLLRQFYPRCVTSQLRDKTAQTIRRVNLDCVARMTEIVDFAESERSLHPGALEEFTGHLVEDVTRANHTLEAQVAEASHQILAAARGVSRPSARMRWGAAAAAAIALSPLACDPLAPPPPPDPLPPPKVRDNEPGEGSEALVVEQKDDNSQFAQPPPDQRDASIALPPPDPPPPPTTIHPPPPPPDPLPPPTLMPPDPLPPPTMKKK